MKCVLIGPVYPYRGGIAHYTTRLAATFRDQGHDLLLISFRRQYPAWLFPGRSDRDPSRQPLPAAEAHYWIDSVNPLTWFSTFARLRRFKPELLVLQWWTSYWAPLWLTLLLLNRLFLRSRVTVVCHNVLPHETHWWDRWIARAVLNPADRIVVHSAAEAAQLHELLPHRAAVVAPLPDFDTFAAEAIPRAAARRRLQLGEDFPLLLFFGFVRPYKGLGRVLQALPAVLAVHRDLKLMIAGEFWTDKGEYLALINRLGIGDAVLIDDRYIPNEEVPVYFAAADALVASYERVTGSAVVGMARGLGLDVIGAGATIHTPGPADAQTPDDLALAILTYLDGWRPGRSSRPAAPGSAEAAWRSLAAKVTSTLD